MWILGLLQHLDALGLLCLTFALVGILNTVDGDGKVFFKKCQYDDSEISHVANATSFSDCLVECSRRHECKAIMFVRTMGLCTLLDDLSTTLLTDGPPMCIYTSIDEWGIDLQSKLGQCNINPCGTGERCTDSIRIKECVKSECPRPREIDHAFPMSRQRSVGTRNAYTCNRGYSARDGIASMTCQNDGTWSNVTFTCLRLCPRPFGLYNNADITSASQVRYLAADVVEFRCKTGFDGGSTSSTCGWDGVWSPRTVRCCEEGKTRYGDVCYMAYNASAMSNRTDMKEYCVSVNGSMANPWPEVRGDVSNATGISFEHMWFADTKDRFEEWHNLTKCLVHYFDVLDAGGPASSDANCDNRTLYTDTILSNYTYQDLVLHINNCTMTGSLCDSAYWWNSPTEPNMDSENENCMFAVNLETGFMGDVPCDYQLADAGFLCEFDLPNV